MAASPDLSIIVAARAFSTDFAPCLAALRQECGTDPAVELLAAGAGDVPASLRTRYPQVVFVSTPSGTAAAATRQAALRQARGQAVAFTDPACRVVPGWRCATRAVLAAYAVAGGAVEPCVQRWRDWAAFWVEYGHYLPPLRRGLASDLTGNNVVYRREALALAGALDSRATAFWKATVHRRLRAAGVALWTEPALVVRHERRVAFAPFLWRRFHHGRCFAASRAAAAPTRRWRYLLGTPLVPVLLLVRLYAAVWPKRCYRRELVLTTPLVLALYSTWALGEWAGTLAGAGGSCELAY